MSFSVSGREEGDDLYLTLEGRVDEFADFSKIIIPEGKNLILDVHGISVFNSLGIVTWIKWMKSIAKHDVIRIQNCTEFFVHKLNFFGDFVPPQTIIESLYLTYYCDECENEDRILLKRRTHYMEKRGTEKDWYKVNPKATCTACGAQTEPEYNLENYLSFLERGFHKG